MSLVDDITAAFSSAIPDAIETIEVRSSFTPPQIYRVSELLKPSTTPNPFLRLLKPTIILRGPALKTPRVIAPAGVLNGTEWKGPVTMVVGGVVTILLLTFVAGRLSVRRRRE